MTIYDNKLSQQRIRHIFHRLGLCNCGLGAQYHIISALLTHADQKKSFYDPVGDLPAHVVHFIGHVMASDHWDLLEHGTSLGFPWLSEEGEILLNFFRDFGTDEDNYPEWVNSCPTGEKW